MGTNPKFLILGGPNGSGKSTAADEVIPPGVIFLNADEIAKSLPDYPSEAANLQAGRLVLEQMDHHEMQRENFAVETTLAGRSLAIRASRLRRTGFHFRLFYLWLPSPEFAIQRVADRVRLGGHHIPESTIRRRYQAGLENVFRLYRPLADSWVLYDNSDPNGYRVIAEGSLAQTERIEQPDLWASIQERANFHG